MARTNDPDLKVTCDYCSKDMHDLNNPDRQRYFTWPRHDKKFCSNKCRQAAYRRRRLLEWEANAATARDNKAKSKARRQKKARLIS